MLPQMINPKPRSFFIDVNSAVYNASPTISDLTPAGKSWRPATRIYLDCLIPNAKIPRSCILSSRGDGKESA